MLSENEIKEYFLLVNSHAKKELGQNFLLDEDVTKSILEALELKKKDRLYYARIIPNSGIYDVCELIIRTVAEDYFVGIDNGVT